MGAGREASLTDNADRKLRQWALRKNGDALELQDIKEFLDRFGAHLPYEIRNDFNRMSARLQGSRGT
jgi:GTP-dependent phosphoenolpyruvate carboxykinase